MHKSRESIDKQQEALQTCSATQQRELLKAFYDYCKEDIECDATEITDLDLYIDTFLKTLID